VHYADTKTVYEMLIFLFKVENQLPMEISAIGTIHAINHYQIPNQNGGNE